MVNTYDVAEIILGSTIDHHPPNLVKLYKFCAQKTWNIDRYRLTEDAYNKHTKDRGVLTITPPQDYTPIFISQAAGNVCDQINEKL